MDQGVSVKFEEKKIETRKREIRISKFYLRI